ncbi:MAG TPA: aldo/keto reductase [Reyranella sp.]|nr:aldo/keto reductase [Reyranella sp.]
MSPTHTDAAASKNALPKRRLGRTDMHITPVGLGAWAIGGGDWAVGWGSQDDTQSIAAIRHAIERGINWIDTAAIYGLGHSEEIVRQALKDMPSAQRPFVFTKCGLRWDDDNRMAAPQNVGAPASIRAECEASLKRLGLERIDLYQMHWPARDGTPIDEYWQTLLALKAEGKVRAVGLSNHSVAQLTAAEKIGHVDTLQPPFSAIRREFAASELPWCLGHDTGVIVYSPMQAGLLTGAFTAERAKTLPADDWRSRNAEFTGAKLTANLELADTMQAVGERHGTSAAAAAIAWTLAWPGVSGAIVGAREPSQVDGWIDAATLHLRQIDLDEIARTIEATGAGSGPALPVEMAR